MWVAVGNVEIVAGTGVVSPSIELAAGTPSGAPTSFSQILASQGTRTRSHHSAPSQHRVSFTINYSSLERSRQTVNL